VVVQNVGADLLGAVERLAVDLVVGGEVFLVVAAAGEWASRARGSAPSLSTNVSSGSTSPAPPASSPDAVSSSRSFACFRAMPSSSDPDIPRVWDGAAYIRIAYFTDLNLAVLRPQAPPLREQERPMVGQVGHSLRLGLLWLRGPWCRSVIDLIRHAAAHSGGMYASIALRTFATLALEPSPVKH
jgi:hypothetical protein